MRTTYFAKAKSLDPKLNLVSIARKTPPNFPGRVMLELAPSYEMLSEIKRTGDEEKYTVDFLKQLDSLDVREVAGKLGEDAILICYEGKDKFCHRHLVANWLQEHGYDVEEM